MCLQDLQLGRNRFTKSSLQTINVAPAQLILNGDSRRVAILVIPNVIIDNVVTLRSGGPGDDKIFFALNVRFASMLCTIEQFGNGICGPIYADSTAAQPYYIIEVLTNQPTKTDNVPI